MLVNVGGTPKKGMMNIYENIDSSYPSHGWWMGWLSNIWAYRSCEPAQSWDFNQFHRAMDIKWGIAGRVDHDNVYCEVAKVLRFKASGYKSTIMATVLIMAPFRVIDPSSEGHFSF